MHHFQSSFVGFVDLLSVFDDHDNLQQKYANSFHSKLRFSELIRVVLVEKYANYWMAALIFLRTLKHSSIFYRVHAVIIATTACACITVCA